MALKENKQITFIVGNSRSGTTMMGRVLGRSENYYTFGELHFYGMLFEPKRDKGEKINEEQAAELFAKLICLEREGFFSDLSAKVKYEKEALACVKENSLSSYEEVYTSFLFREAQLNNGTVPCEQTPKNLFFMKDIFNLPYSVRVINMVRDPRDILSSQKQKWKRRYLGSTGIPLREAVRSWFNYHPIVISLIWRSAIREYQKHMNNPNLLCVKFEGFLSNPTSELKKICSFLEINYDPEMLSVPQVGSSDESDSQKLGIQSKRINPWEFNGVLSRTEIYMCEKICFKELKSMSYAPSNFKPNIFLLGYYYFTLPLKMTVALLLNVKRMKSLFSMAHKYFFKDGK